MLPVYCCYIIPYASRGRVTRTRRYTCGLLHSRLMDGVRLSGCCEYKQKLFFGSEMKVFGYATAQSCCVPSFDIQIFRHSDISGALLQGTGCSTQYGVIEPSKLETGENNKQTTNKPKLEILEIMKFMKVDIIRSIVRIMRTAGGCIHHKNKKQKWCVRERERVLSTPPCRA